MNDDRVLERTAASVLAETAPSRGPDHLLDDVFSTTRRTRQRPRWLAYIKEPPMHISSRIAVGSPTARLASIALATLLLAAMATGAVVAGASLLAGPGVIVVAQDGSGTVTTITEAVAMAEDGDTIMVKPGTYAESLTVTKDITIEGDRDEIVVDLTDVEPSFDYGGEIVRNAFVLDDTSASLANLTIRGGTPIVAIVVIAGAPTLEDLVVDLTDQMSGQHEMSLHMEGSSPVVRRSTLDGYVSMFEDSDVIPGGPFVLSPTIESNDFPGPIGLDIGGGTAIVRDNVFHDAPPFTAPCCGSFPGGIGIDGTDGLIEDNVFMDYVVSIRGGGSPTFRRNTVRDGAPGVPGISIDEGASPLVEDNEVTGNGVGIQIRDGDPVLRNNTVRDNSVAGISVTNGSPTLEGNTVEANKLGLGLGVNAAPILIGNVICGNETNVNVLEGSTVTVAGNETCP